MTRVFSTAFSICLFLIVAASAEAQVIPTVPQADTTLTNPEREIAEPEKKPDQFGKNIADSIQTFAVRTGNVSYYSVCPGSRNHRYPSRHRDPSTTIIYSRCNSWMFGETSW